MQLIKIERTSTGYMLDPNAYLDQLDELASRLPPGAAAFARDPDHYDPHSARCVKDLKLKRVVVVDSHATLGMELSFHFAPKYDLDLVIQYRDVFHVSIDVTSTADPKHVWPDTRRLSDVQLDEILPHDKGCSHEIRMIGGTILVVSADLVAEWHAGAVEIN